MRIFVDVGSHEGQSIEEAVKDRWAFDEIHAIEPMPREINILVDRFEPDPRVKIHPYALYGITGSILMFGTNDALEASIYAAKDDVDPLFMTSVHCVSATSFFEGLPDAEIYVNLNCEGAEVPILDSLMDSGEIHRIAHILVSFDIAKVKGQESEETRIRGRLDKVGFDRITSDYADLPTHQEQIAAWLESV